MTQNNYIDTVNKQLQTVIKEKETQKSLLVDKITDKSSSKVLIGGFLQPGQIKANKDSQHGKRINRLMEDLKSREQELYNLNYNLKLTQAIDKAEQAELARSKEEQYRLSLEGRINEAVSQAQLASEQMHIAIEKAQEAENAQIEEEQLRKIAEAKIDEANCQAHAAKIELQAIMQEKQTLEEKSRISLSQAVQAENSRQATEVELTNANHRILELQERLKQSDATYKTALHTSAETENKLNLLENTLLGLRNEKLELEENHYKNINKLEYLEQQLKESKEQEDILEQKISDLIKQNNKLQGIIETEKELRALADKRSKEAIEQAQKADNLCKSEIKQRKLMDERAKRAVSHASKTIMQFLNAPITDDNPTAQLSSLGLDLAESGETIEGIESK